MTDVDAKLKLLFAAPATPPDEAFVNRVNCAVVAEQKMLAAKVAMWRRFAVELAGATAVLVAFYVLWKVGPSGVEIEPLATAPGVAASMILFLWLTVQSKQSQRWVARA